MQVHPESSVKSNKMQDIFKNKIRVVVAGKVFVDHVNNKRLVLREARKRAADATSINIRRLEMAQHQGLKLPTEDGAVVEDSERDEQAKIIRDMVIRMTEKRTLRFDSQSDLTPYSNLLS